MGWRELRGWGDLLLGWDAMYRIELLFIERRGVQKIERVSESESAYLWWRDHCWVRRLRSGLVPKLHPRVSCRQDGSLNKSLRRPFHRARVESEFPDSTRSIRLSRCKWWKQQQERQQQERKRPGSGKSNPNLTSKANATKRNLAPVSDDAVMSAVYHWTNICLQLYPRFFLFI